MGFLGSFIALQISALGRVNDSLPDSMLSPKAPSSPRTANNLKNKWRNTTLRIFYRQMPPYVNDDHGGIEQNILRMALDHLGMSNTSLMEATSFQSWKNGTTGNYTNSALLSLQYNEVDVVVGAFHPTEEIYNDFQGSIIYIVDTLNLILPNLLEPQTVWSRIIEIYSWQFSLASVLCLILILFFLRYFCNFFRRSFPEDVALYIYWFFQMIIDSPVHRIHKLCPFRLVVFSILSFSLIHSTAFKNNLEIIYFSEKYVVPDESHLVLYVPSADAFPSNATSDVSYNDTYTNMVTKLRVCSDVTECLERISHCKDRRMLFLVTPVVYAIPKRFMDKSTYQPLLLIGRVFQTVPIHMIFQKFVPAFEDVNTVLRRLFENGLVDREVAIVRWKWRLEVSKLRKLKSRVLTVEHLRFIFVLWSVGLGFAFLVFLVELGIFYYL